tara:strand:+ start:751 stop:1458 length:708 start_codon:yes stop_codon:yes gene_type:complete
MKKLLIISTYLFFSLYAFSNESLINETDNNTILAKDILENGVDNINLYTSSNIVIWGDYGNNMFSFNPFQSILGRVEFDYQRFSSSGSSSIKIPLLIDFTLGYVQDYDYYTEDLALNYNWPYRMNFRTGFEQKFFPTGSDGGVRGFFGYGAHLGIITTEAITYFYDWDGNYYYSISEPTSFWSDIQFIGGVQFHPSSLINITIDAGIGLGGFDFESGDPNLYVVPDLGISLGFRF